MINFGAVPIGAVLPVFFDSFAGSTGASVTITGLAVTDIEIYKGTSMTQRSSDAGYALIDTDGIDLDGITGIHGFSIDTGDNTDAGFYAAGSYYNVVVSAITVDSQTVSFLAATFRCVTAEGVAGQPKVDAAAFGGTAGTFSGGRPEVNTTHAAGTAWGSGAITAASIASGAVTSAKFAAGAIDAAAIADNAIDLATFAADAKALMGVIAFGTAQSVTGTTIRLASAETFADDEIIGATVIIRSASTGAGQARVITDYVSSTDTATVDTWTTTPTGTITYIVIATAPASTSAPIAANVTQWLGTACATPTVAGVPEVDVTHFNGTAGTFSSGIPEVKVNNIAANAITAAATASDFGAEIADAVWDEALSGHTTAGTSGKALSDAGSAGDPWSTSLPGAYGAGTAGKILGDNLNATVSSRASQTSVDTIDDFLDTEIAAILADTNELQTDWANGGRLDLILDARASQTSVDTIDDFLDTEIAAIKAKTDSLTFTVAGQVDANIQSVNDVTVTGNGGSGTEWGP